MTRTLQALGALLLVATLASAQARPPGMSGETGSWYPLGGIDAMGEIEGDKAVVIKVTKVFEDGLAAKGGLKVGDMIVGIGQKKFKSEGVDLIAELEEAIEEAEEKKPEYGKKFRRLTLRVERDGKKEKVEVPVRFFGPHTSPFPYKCSKCKVIIREALEFLKEEQTGDGKFPKQISNGNHSISMSSLAGLAWLGDKNARKRYGENISKAADYVMRDAGAGDGFERPAGGANWNQTHWALGYGSMFIGEAHAHKKSAEYRAALSKWSKLLCEQQEESGGWAHGPGGKNALDYLELEIMSNFALAGLGFAQRAKLQVDEAKIIKGIEFVKACTQGGGVAYSPQKGQFGHGDPGRTAGAWWAFRLLGAKEKKLMSEMESFWQRGLDDLFEGHACPTMHVLSGALASAMDGDKTLAKFWKTFKPFMMASRIPGGAFDTRPNKESKQMGRGPTDKTWGTVFVTASYAIAMQAGGDTYELIDSAK